MTAETIDCSVDGPVATITLHRPAVLNCINEQLLRDLDAGLELVSARGARVVVIRGAGRAFCSGIDVKALATGRISDQFFRDWEVMLRKIELMDASFVAAVQGYCIGGGLQLALACDLRVVGRSARLGVTAVKEGLVPGMGMWRIARHAGVGRARQLALMADLIDAQTASDWGLVEYVTDEEPYGFAMSAVAPRLLDMASTSLIATKHLINCSCDLPFDAFLERFCDAQRRSVASSRHGDRTSAASPVDAP